MSKRNYGIRTPHPQRKLRPDIAKVFDSARGVYEPQLTEEHVVKEIMQRLGYAGIRIYRHKERIPRYSGDRHLSRRGLPDLFGYVAGRPPIMGVGGAQTLGRAVFIECKKPGGERSLEQKLFIGDARANGAIACFAESWLDVCDEFSRHGIALPK